MFTETNKKLSKGRKNHPRVGILHALIFRLNMRALRIVNRTARSLSRRITRRITSGEAMQKELRRSARYLWRPHAFCVSFGACGARVDDARSARSHRNTKSARTP